MSFVQQKQKRHQKMRDLNPIPLVDVQDFSSPFALRRESILPGQWLVQHALVANKLVRPRGRRRRVTR